MTASALEGAKQWFQTFLDQWKTGRRAEVEFHCESGQLQVRMHADLGPWRASAGSFCLEVWSSGGQQMAKMSPSRMRRRERRAAAAKEAAALKASVNNGAEKSSAADKAALVNAAAERADADNVAADDAATAEKAAGAEYSAAVKVAEESVAAEIAATESQEVKKAESAAANKAAESASARKAAESDALVLDPDISDHIASTSSRNREILCCWNCSKEMTPEHQCEVPPPVLPSVKLPEIGKTFFHRV